MTDCIYVSVSSACFNLAYGAVSNCIVAACSRTSGGYVILSYGNAVGVTERRNLVCKVGVTAYLTGICRIALRGAGGIGHNRVIIVSECGNFGLRNYNIVTYRTILALRKTCFCTSGGLSGDDSLGVSVDLFLNSYCSVIHL